MTTQLLALCGFAGAGKDAVADVLVNEYGYIAQAFADPLREMAAAINPILEDDGETQDGLIRYCAVVDALGYDEAKRRYPEMREFLQRLGTEAGRGVLGENVLVDAAFLHADNDLAHDDDVVFTDCRFLNEAEAVRERGGSIVLVIRPGVEATNGHVSERFAAELEDSGGYDYLLSNDGTLDDLYAKVETMLDALSS